MKFTIDTKDIQIYSSASTGLRGIFDESGNQVYDNLDEVYEWFDLNFARIRKCQTLQDVIDMIKPNIPYSLEIKDNTVILNASAPNGYYIEYTWGNEITFAQIM